MGGHVILSFAVQRASPWLTDFVLNVMASLRSSSLRAHHWFGISPTGFERQRVMGCQRISRQKDAPFESLAAKVRAVNYEKVMPR